MTNLSSEELAARYRQAKQYILCTDASDLTIARTVGLYIGEIRNLRKELNI